MVLIGLAAAAALMPVKVSEEQQKEADRRDQALRPDVKPLEPVVLTNALETLARVEQPTDIKLAGEHNVFNPVKWQRRPDGGIMKVDPASEAEQVSRLEAFRKERDALLSFTPANATSELSTA